MKIVELLGALPTFLTNDQAELFQYIDKLGKVSSEDLSDNGIRTAEELCQRGMLYGTEKINKNGSPEYLYTIATF
jgi:hypothetical protein